MPKLAVLTDTIRADNHLPLKYFNKIEVRHFYKSAPYGDLKDEDLKNAHKWHNLGELEEKIIEFKPDIIQGAEPYASRSQLRLCRLAYKLSKQLKIPLIFPMLENRPPEKRFGNIKGLIMKRILSIYAKRAKLIFYLNNGARKNLLAAKANPKKLKRMLYGIWGVDTGLFKPELKTKNLKLKTDYILFVGRLDEAKGIPYLLEAWNKIINEYPDLKMVFIGDGELKDRVKGDRVQRLGIKKNEDLPEYFSNALFTVYPSVTLQKWEEQIGTVNLQSLACGTPVVTTKSGAIPEYVNDQVGLLVPERDSDALAEAMKKLLKNDKLREKLSKNSRPYILENYDAQKTVEKVERILLELVKK